MFDITGIITEPTGHPLKGTIQTTPERTNIRTRCQCEININA